MNTLKRDNMSEKPTPDARTILASLPRWAYEPAGFRLALGLKDAKLVLGAAAEVQGTDAGGEPAPRAVFWPA